MAQSTISDALPTHFGGVAMISALAPIVGLLIAAFLSPGPNNLIVVGVAARKGFWRALPVMAGIITGTIVLYLLAVAGLAQLILTHRAVALAVLIAGVAYLIYLGARRLFRTDQADPVVHSTQDPTIVGVALLQLVNPKGLVLIGTIAASSVEGPIGIVMMIVLIVLTTAASLSIWALAGTVLTRFLSNPRKRRIFDGVLGMLLIASAIMILLFGWETLQ